ncbi:MAG: sulfatase-like hydrolase/transferase, partial [Actinobacteria bacterium]|nr:sulfatase-like hydrolase/transferase [Actinomycetota bacterium]
MTPAPTPRPAHVPGDPNATAAPADGEARNVLFITVDQWRGDSLSCVGHPLVQTPTLDALAADGVLFRSHFANIAPCAPSRASLYTGLYAHNHRVITNGTPLDDRHDNIARMARRAGYTPTLFGYTDTAIDPRTVSADDPRLFNYEGVLDGFD